MNNSLESWVTITIIIISVIVPCWVQWKQISRILSPLGFMHSVMPCEYVRSLTYCLTDWLTHLFAILLAMSGFKLSQLIHFALFFTELLTSVSSVWIFGSLDCQKIPFQGFIQHTIMQKTPSFILHYILFSFTIFYVTSIFQ